jgi:hypothetical protein
MQQQGLLDDLGNPASESLGRQAWSPLGASDARLLGDVAPPTQTSAVFVLAQLADFKRLRKRAAKHDAGGPTSPEAGQGCVLRRWACSVLVEVTRRFVDLRAYRRLFF